MFRVMRNDYALAAIASRQAGFLGHDQVVSLGFSKAAIKHRTETGMWSVAGRGLYKVNGINASQQGLLRAATAILPGNPTVSHESAAEIHGIPYVARGLSVVTVQARTTHDFPGVEVHRSLDMLAEHRQLIDSMWTTSPERTLNDLPAVLHPSAMALALDDSLARKLILIEDVERVFNQVARRGRDGCGLMRRLLEERVGDELITASRLERLGLRVFERGGLPTPLWQYPAPWDFERRIDFAWPHVCVGCECDGRRWHSRLADFQSDRTRDNLSLTHNWRIFRYTWEDFTKRPHFVIAQLREAIES
ncbi:MAG TPA: hypothetical protein VJQ57_07525 [Acidimicrobiia bacterium]|nr:hypothetical protein [Acidimicrobiia bacterium]